MYTTCLNVSNELIHTRVLGLHYSQLNQLNCLLPHCKKLVCGTVKLQTTVNKYTLSDGTLSILITSHDPHALVVVLSQKADEC